MKILFIAPKYSGGIGGHTARLASKLREHGFEIKLMRVPVVPIKNLKNPSFVLFSSLYAIFNREKFEVVHAFNLPSVFAMKLTKAKKKVLSIHGMYSEQINALHSQMISSNVKNNEKTLLKWADVLLTNSKNVKHNYKKKLGMDFDYIYGPIDIDKFKKIESNKTKNEKQVVYIGRDSYEKGIDILKKIESKIEAKVVYCINLEWGKAMAILKSSDILIVPSRIDNIPNVIKEAFYLKIPVVATDIEGISEIITNNTNGILVPSENPEEIFIAVNKLLKDEKKAKRIAENGYQFVMENLTWNVLVSKYIKFYENLINR